MSASSVSTTNAQNSKVCVLCKSNINDEVLYGKIYNCDSVTAHHYCLLFASALLQKGKDDEGIFGFMPKDIENEVKRGKKLTCSVCLKTGATVGCCIKSCSKKFHYPCGLSSGMISQFFNVFNSFCCKHSPVQKVTASGYSLRRAITEKLTATCMICFEDVPAQVSYEVLWAPCCSKQSWFHRRCVQTLALSAGYFFKCPLCSNNTIFCDEMRRMGIYIPDQDASWELEPNAFQELTERHSTCDATPCVCPRGKEFDGEGTRWELLLCISCGSKGTHIGCGNLAWSTMEWNCADCSALISKNELQVLTETSDRPRPAATVIEDDSDDSDIDIIGEYPPPKMRTVSVESAGASGSSNLATSGSSSSLPGSTRLPQPSCSRSGNSTNQTCSLERYRFKVVNDKQLLVFIDEDVGTVFAGSVSLSQPKRPRLNAVNVDQNEENTPPEVYKFGKS